MELQNQRKRILLVEDDAQLLGKLGSLLTTILGADVEQVSDGAAAVDQLQKKRFDIVVSDIKMPKMDGLELLCCTQKIGVEVPFIFLSAHTDKDTALRALRLGACDLLEKPFQVEDLINSINSKVFRKQNRGFDASKYFLKETPRRVLELLMTGRSNKQIAEALNLSEPSVKYHIGILLEKFGAKNRQDLFEKLSAPQRPV